jgi:hypothetical protein
VTSQALLGAADAIKERLDARRREAERVTARRDRVMEQIARLRTTDPDAESEAEVAKVRAEAELVAAGPPDGDGLGDELVPFEMLLDVVHGCGRRRGALRDAEGAVRPPCGDVGPIRPVDA